MKCYWSASWRFVWMHPGVSAGLTVTVSSLHHCHYSGQCHGAQRVRDVPQEYGKCVDKKPVTCDYGDIFKAYAQAKAIQKKECNICLQRRSTELLLALKERLCGLDIRVEILWEQSFPLDISHRLTALLCCVQTNGKHGDWSIRALSWESLLLCRLSEWVWERQFFDG